VVVLGTGAEPAESPGRFWLDSAPSSRTTGLDDAGVPGLLLGGPDPAAPGSACARLAALGHPCGPVDAAVRNSGLGRVIIQNGGADGRATAVQLVGNSFLGSSGPALLVRPSRFASAPGDRPEDAAGFAANRFVSTGGGALVFDGAPYDGAAAPDASPTWVIGDSTPLYACGVDESSACGIGPFLVARNRARVVARRVAWQRAPADSPDDFIVESGGQIDDGDACPFVTTCL
jgi:hypothetical protein